MSAAICRMCGCTESMPCISADGACYWVDDTLCSACAGPAAIELDDDDDDDGPDVEAEWERTHGGDEVH